MNRFFVCIKSKRKENVMSEDKRLMCACLRACMFFCALYSTCMIVYASLLRSFLMMIADGLSLFVCCVLLPVLLGLGKYKASWIVFSVWFTLYLILYSTFWGLNTYAAGYFLLLVSLQFIAAYPDRKVRNAIAALQIIAIFACIIIEIVNAQRIVYSGLSVRFLSAFNLFFLTLGTIMIARYASGIKRANELGQEDISRLLLQAYTDSLTGLYNRRYADKFFSELIPKNFIFPSCIAIIDIDDFKSVNDTYGHLCGDKILVQFSRYLNKILRQTDIVFRWGGEEFLVVLQGTDLKNARRVLEGIAAEIGNEDFAVEGIAVRLTVTIGVSVLNPHDPEVSIKNCDKNLYIGKKRNKNIVISIN